MALAGMFLVGWVGTAHASAAVAKIAAGVNDTFFVKTDGTLWALGDNSFGQLGDGTTSSRSTSVQVSGGTNVSAVAVGSLHSVFLKTDKTLWSVGAFSTSHTPVEVSGVSNVIAIAARRGSSVFVKTDNTLWTVGIVSGSSVPVEVSGGTNVIAVAVGYNHTVFLKTDGTLWAMGDNTWGQLGDGTTSMQGVPVQVSGGTNVAAVAAGGNHTVFVKTDGTLWAVGDNSSGQLGDGTTTSRSTPVQVSGGTNVAAVVTGGAYTVFLKTDGILWAMGENSSGQLGDGTTTNRSTPVQVSGGVNVAAVAAGDAHTVFLKTNGTLWGMGSNDYGQLSNSNPLGSITTPALINQSILLTPIGAKSAVVGCPVSFTISATDIDNGTLTYSASNLPSGATFTPATKNFSWTPVLADVGSYNVTFSVTTGLSTVSETIALTVTATDVTAPSVPTELSASLASPTTALITWTASTDNVAVDHYLVYRDGTQIGTAVSPSYSDTGLQGGITYSYVVFAVDGAGNISAQSSSVSFKMPFTGAQTRDVNDVYKLTAAITEAAANPLATFTINIALGTYTLGSTALPDLPAGTIIQGPSSGSAVYIDGAALPGGVIFNVTGKNVQIGYIGFKNAATHSITIQPGADDGMIVGCTFENTRTPTAAVDGRGCAGWIVGANTFTGITGTTGTAEPAVYFHAGATDLTISFNLFLDCDRGIGVGSGASDGNDSVAILNNMIADNRTTGYPGAGISFESVTNGFIYNNTVYQAGNYANSIEYKYSPGASIINNLVSKAITGVSSASPTLLTNKTSALASWFKDPADCDLRLASYVAGVVDAGTTITGLTYDIEGDPRPTGSAYDIGADEYTESYTPDSGGSTTPVYSSGGGGGGGGGGAPGGWFFAAILVLGVLRGLTARRLVADHK